MDILISLNGIFPRSQNLIDETRKFEHRSITKSELKVAFKNDYKNLQILLKEFDLISDGLLCWQDLLRPFSVLIKNTEVNGLIRYFETNCFYRRILLPDKIEFDFKKWYPEYFRFGNTAFLPSIETFKYFSNAKYELIVTILSETIKFLYSKEYKYIVLQAPAILFDFDYRLKLYTKKLVSNIRKNCAGIVLIINTFFKKISEEVLQFLFNEDIDGVGIDFIHNSLEEICNLPWKQDKGIFAGILNTFSTKMEDIKLVEQFIISLQNEVNPRFIIVSGSPDFEFLPFDYAVRKVEILKTIRRRVNNNKV